MSGQNPLPSFPFVLLLLVFGLGNVLSTHKVCTDALGTRECLRYKDEDCVGVYETWARTNCSLRCGYCPIRRLQCLDNINYCSDFGADVCQQELYGQYMRENCRKTCNFCRVPTEYLVSRTTWAATPVQTTQTTTYNPARKWCFDRRRYNCWRYPAEKCIGFYENWFRKYCPFRCGYCPNLLPPCEDVDTSCEAYSLEACTNQTYRAYMRENCRKTCNECHYPGQYLVPNTPPYGFYTTTTTSVLSTRKVMALSTKPNVIVPTTERWLNPALYPLMPDNKKPQEVGRVNINETTVIAVPSKPIVIVPTKRWGSPIITPIAPDSNKAQELERVNITEASDIVSVIGNSHLLQTNEAFNVSCRITGYKQASDVNDTVGWLFNGQRISFLRMVSNADKYKLHVNSTNLYLEVGLEIPAVTAEDSGNYTCVFGDRAYKNHFQEMSWYLQVMCIDCIQTVVG